MLRQARFACVQHKQVHRLLAYFGKRASFVWITVSYKLILLTVNQLYFLSNISKKRIMIAFNVTLHDCLRGNVMRLAFNLTLPGVSFYCFVVVAFGVYVSACS